MGSIRKQILDPTRVRVIPKEGFSWIDRRFLCHGFAEPLGTTEILLYWFLCSVADRHGLSYYSDRRIGGLLKLAHGVLEKARLELLRQDLILYRDPLYQVVSLPELIAQQPQISPKSAGASRSRQTDFRPIREILGKMR